MATLTYCKRNHELTEDNVYVVPNGGQQCKQCRAENKNKYRRTEKGKIAEARKNILDRTKYKHKWLARQKLAYAVKTGKLIKPDVCELDNDCVGRLEAHHDDYDKPLDVKWLCMKHHRELHER